MGGLGRKFGSGMPPKLEKDAKSGRIIMIASEPLLDRVEEWRRQQPRIPTKSEAVRILVEQALDARERQKPKPD